jgi:NADH dehydrogenase
VILIAGGSGTLGSLVASDLTKRGLAVRVLTRDPEHARALLGDHVEVVRGDVRDAASVRRAVIGVETIVSAIHGLVGSDGPRSVDYHGNCNLIDAAQQAGVQHLVLVSVHQAAPDHPMELMRMKHAAEQRLRASALAWTIVRPTAFMETWTRLLVEPLVRTGQTRIFGRGDNPINFVSVQDVARLIERAVLDAALRGQTIDLGGPENLTFREFVQIAQQVTGVSGTISSVPRPAMRCAAAVLRLFQPALARQIQAGLVMDTTDMRFDTATPDECLTLAQALARDFASRPRASMGGGLSAAAAPTPRH